MRNSSIFFALCAFLFLSVACETQKNEVGNITFSLDKDTLVIPSDSGEVYLTYNLSEHPEEGQFVVYTESGDKWISFLGDNAAESTIALEVKENTAIEDRVDTVTIRFDYNGGSVSDSFVITQEGRGYDVLIEAKICTGEYYVKDRNGNSKYYVWVSTQGLWVDDSEGINFDLYAPEPELNDEGMVRTIPEGTYTFAAGEYEQGTFSELSYYGIASGKFYMPQYFLTGGTMTVTHLDENGDNIKIDALVNGMDGRIYRLRFEGSVEDMPYMYE